MLTDAYSKNPRNSDTDKVAVINLKLAQYCFIIIIGPNNADGMANRVDSDQIAPLFMLKRHL